MRLRSKIASQVATALLLLLAGSAPAWAHASCVRSYPRDLPTLETHARFWRPDVALPLPSPVGRACGSKKVSLHRVQQVGAGSPRRDFLPCLGVEIPVPLRSFLTAVDERHRQAVTQVRKAPMALPSVARPALSPSTVHRAPSGRGQGPGTARQHHKPGARLRQSRRDHQGRGWHRRYRTILGSARRQAGAQGWKVHLRPSQGPPIGGHCGGGRQPRLRGSSAPCEPFQGRDDELPAGHHQEQDSAGTPSAAHLYFSGHRATGCGWPAAPRSLRSS